MYNAVLDTVVRVCQLPGEDKKHRHTFYQMNAKVGTIPALVWYVDKIPDAGEYCYFCNEFDSCCSVSPRQSNFSLVCGPSNIFRGYCDRKNDDGYCFLRRE